MNRFLKGKMYNRCRRGHINLSTALHGLHFQSFLMDAHTDIDFTYELKVWLETKSNQLSNQYQKSMKPLQGREAKQHNFG